MKQIRNFTGLIALVFLAVSLQAQDVNAKLKEAQSAYSSGRLEETRFALQEALNGINTLIGKEILGLVPSSMANMKKTEGGDQITGESLGYAGLHVKRSYEGTGSNASVEIVSDSPLLAGVNTILALPVLVASDPSQKRIRVGSYRALMNINTDEAGNVSYEVLVPFGSSLLTLKCSGIADEAEVTGMANTLPMDKIAKLAQ